MKMFARSRRASLLHLFTAATLCLAQGSAGSGALLNRAQASKLMPATVFFRGRNAPIQGRNSGGVHFPDGKYMLAALVDTSGYATDTKQRYQGYLLTEAPLDFSGRQLPPGSYGFGFLAGRRFVVLDIGGNQILEAASHPFQGKRPVPLEVLAAGSGYELCSGRECVTFHRKPSR